MSAQMLLQFPLLALCGLVLAGAVPSAWRTGVERWNAYGISGLFGIAMLAALLMSPRLLDLAVTDARIDLLKTLALVLGGMAWRLSWRPAGWLVQGFFLGNVLPMTAAVGQLYQDSPARLCNAYLLDDQVRLGRMLVGIAVVIAIAWFARLVLALMRREDATLPAQRVTAGSASPGNR